MNKKQLKQPKTGVLLKYIIKEKSSNKIIMELPPTKASEVKANRMSSLEDIEVIREYSK